MKIETRFTTHLNRWYYFHFWLIPSIEVDHEDFPFDEIYHHWTHITIAWLIFSLDIEFIKYGNRESKHPKEEQEKED